VRELDVAVVGAGAAGIGCGVVLDDLELDFEILERYEIGSSFERWPEEMRFLTPSFTANAFGLMDLNAIAPGTSPAYTLGCEHPTGREYARYLRGVADYFELPVRTGVEVHDVQPLPEGGFELDTSRGELRSRFVVWAAGEFQYPNLTPFPGSELCRHSSLVRSWRAVEGDEILVIGGYESGLDAAIHLSASGRRVRVLDAAASWDADDSDPSLTLSPYTRERLEAAAATGRIELVGDARVESVERADSSGYAVHAAGGRKWSTAAPPILATGFAGSLRRISALFEWENGHAVLTGEDESTVVPGLFVVGPEVRHGAAIFCFIYKFRQRFAVVARAIAERLGADTSILDLYRQHGLLLDDLSCCEDECVC
jgi:putative flavoprotein involved in K+ transport